MGQGVDATVDRLARIAALHQQLDELQLDADIISEYIAAVKEAIAEQEKILEEIEDGQCDS